VVANKSQAKLPRSDGPRPLVLKILMSRFSVALAFSPAPDASSASWSFALHRNSP